MVPTQQFQALGPVAANPPMTHPASQVQIPPAPPGVDRAAWEFSYTVGELADRCANYCAGASQWRGVLSMFNRDGHHQQLKQSVMQVRQNHVHRIADRMGGPGSATHMAWHSVAVQGPSITGSVLSNVQSVMDKEFHNFYSNATQACEMLHQVMNNTQQYNIESQGVQRLTGDSCTCNTEHCGLVPRGGIQAVPTAPSEPGMQQELAHDS